MRMQIMTFALLIMSLVLPVNTSAQTPIPPAVPSISQPAAPSVTPATPVTEKAVAAPVVAAADPTKVMTPEDIAATQVPGLVATVFKAIKDKNWSLLTGALLLLITFFLNLFWLKNYPKEKITPYLPWITVGFGFLLQFGSCLATGDGWMQAVNTAFVTGATAAGLWSMLGKLLLGRFLKPSSEQQQPKPA